TLELPCRRAALVHRGVRRLGLFLVAPAEREAAEHLLQIVVAPGPPLRAELRVDDQRIRGGAIEGVASALRSVAADRPVRRGPIRCILVDERDVAQVAALGLSRPAG